METKKCPHCEKTVLAISKVCKHCGKSFETTNENTPTETPAVTTTETPPSSVGMFCSKCGKPIKDGVKFCGHCGATLTNSSAPIQSGEPQRMVTDDEPEKNQTYITLGYLCWAFGVIDFCGIFFEYDLTGVPWSPIVAGVVGQSLYKLGTKSTIY